MSPFPLACVSSIPQGDLSDDLPGHRLHIDPARRGCDRNEGPVPSVEGDGEVHFGVVWVGFLHQQRIRSLPAYGQPEDPGPFSLSLGGVVDKRDASGLPSATREHLGLQSYRGGERGNGSTYSVDVVNDDGPWDWEPVLLEELLRLILEKAHKRGASSWGLKLTA